MEMHNPSLFDERLLEGVVVQNVPVALTPEQAREQILTIQLTLLAELSQAADAYARHTIFLKRQHVRAWNTVRKEIAALSLFMEYLGLLQQARQTGEAFPLGIHLAEEPRLWSVITFGLVETFLIWEREQGYSIKTMNDHLDIIKLYSKLAHQAGHMSIDQVYAITHLPHLRGVEAFGLDARRPVKRRGAKKAEPTFLSRREFQALITRPDTPQGWRDRVAILLMYDLSLRPSEVVSLTMSDLDMDKGTLRITRHTTHTTQRARLKDRLFLAMQHYLRHRQDQTPDAPLLVTTRKNGKLVENLPWKDSTLIAASRGGRRPTSPNQHRYQELQPQQAYNGVHSAADGTTLVWTPPLSTRGLREHLHELGMDIADDLYGEQEGTKKPPRTRRLPPQKEINLTSYDGRHEWTRNAVHGGSDPIVVTKAGGWAAHSPMVLRYYGELEVINDEIVLER